MIKNTLETPRESPWGKTTKEQKLGLEFEKKNMMKSIDIVMK